MVITLRNIQYHPNADSVGLLMEHRWGSFFVTTTQTALAARAPAGEVWGDAEALAEAQLGCDTLFPADGWVAVLPDPPAPPAPPANP
jgi:hypothetical protein